MAVSPHVSQMMALIEERSAEHLSLRTLAQVLGRQEAYLGRLFRQEVGVSVHEYLCSRRLERAAGLIQKGEKVEAVALEVGYRSKKNFYRQFIRRFGSTPAAYRQRTARASSAPPLGPAIVNGLSLRLLGPAAAGGRIADIAAVESRPATFYAAAGIGGLWATRNNGTTWEPLCDRDRTAPVGAVAVAVADPNHLWIGTGEHGRSGDGVYKSVDAGRTWERAGLRTVPHIARVVIDARDPETVYVTAVGPRWGRGNEGGLYKTADGGATWVKMLSVSDDSAVADVVMHPRDSKVVIAALCRRTPPATGHRDSSASGLYRTEDSGATWARLSLDLPHGHVGRAGLDICRGRPNVLYAYIGGMDGGVYRSDDAGRSWQLVSRDVAGTTSIRVDPDDPERVYQLGSRLRISGDGGRTFHDDGVGVRSSIAAMWIDPNDPQHVIIGSNEGISVSYDRARTWLRYRNLPIGRFLQVSVDMQKPYNVYGGLQGGGAWRGPSASRHVYGILNKDWFAIPGGTLFAQPDPADSNTIYTLGSNRQLVRHDPRTGEHKVICPETLSTAPLRGRDSAHAFVISRFDPSTIYLGADRVYRSTDRGLSWTAISAEVGTMAAADAAGPAQAGDPWAASVTGGPAVITSLAESARTPELLYAGTSDAGVFVRRDCDGTWEDVSARFHGLPPGVRVSRIATSWSEADTAYVVFGGQAHGDAAPHLFMTKDAGRSWQSIASDLPSGPAHVVHEDPRNPDLLYAGTETGLFVSFSRGARWMPLAGNLPAAAVSDLVVHPRDNDLVVATRGRGIWILDDATALQELSADVLRSAARLFPVRSGIQMVQDGDGVPLGDAAFAASNPPAGTILSYYLRDKAAGAVKLVIKDSRGAAVRELEGRREPGVHRIPWDLRLPPPKHAVLGVHEGAVGARALLGAFVLPGDYTVTLVVNGSPCGTQAVKVEADPLVNLPDAARDLQQRAITELTAMQDAVAAAAEALRAVATQLEVVHDRLQRGLMMPRTVREHGSSLVRKVSILRRLLQSSHGGAETASGWPIDLGARIDDLKIEIAGSCSTPTPLQTRRLAKLQIELAELVAQLKGIMAEDLPTLNRQLEQSGLSPVRLSMRPLPTFAAAG